MANVVQLSPRPGVALAAIRARPVSAFPPATYRHFTEYALPDVARRLGLLQFGVRTIVEKLRILAEKDGMPLPRTVRIANREPVRGPLVIYSKSRWDAGEFDAWIDGRGPSGGGAAIARPLPAPIRAEMADRAARIASVA